MLSNSVGLLDGATLQTSTISTVSTGSSINTSGQRSLAIQVSGTGYGNIQIQGSNDNSNWQTLTVIDALSLTLTDTLQVNGIYSLNVISLYVRYNCTAISGSLSWLVIGRATAPAKAVDRLTQAMDAESAAALNVNLAAGLKRDVNNALVLSDSYGPISVSGSVGAIIIIDTTGYKTLSITSSTFAATMTTGNDGVTWTALNGFTTAGANTTSATAGVSTFWPCNARYIRLTISTAGIGVAYLKIIEPVQAIGPAPPIGVTQIGGTNVVTANIAGMLAVGGNVATGSAPTAFPINVSGIDGNGKIRSVLTDTVGRLQTAIPAATLANVNLFGTSTIAVSDVTIDDNGNRMIDIMNLILTELRIISQQQYEQRFGLQSVFDDPALNRNNPDQFSLN